MARVLNRLSAMTLRRISAPGMYPDGGGLYLQVKASENGRPNKSWIFRYALSNVVRSKHGKERQQERLMGLGSLDTINLSEARELATNCRKQRLAGIDPIEARRTERERTAVAALREKTFDQCRDEFISMKRHGWRNIKHAAQWKSSLETYVTPVFGHISVRAVDTALVTKVLEPIWVTKSETATRVRGRIETILNFAKAKGLRDGENPARFRGHLDQILPRKSDVRKVKHHAALPYNRVGEFIRDLRSRTGTAARALEFTILTAARTNEIIGMRWTEVDLEAGVWTVPGERMKGRRDHRVPLSSRAVEILKKQLSLRENDFVFPGDRRPNLSNMAMDMLLRRMQQDVTVHGFRSTFKDWASEQTAYPNELSEAALAHVIGDQTEAAYRRGDMFEKRMRLMTDWSAFCAASTRKGSVTPIRAGV